jgi:DNA-binding transcriptional ArsR family regulator
VQGKWTKILRDASFTGSHPLKTAEGGAASFSVRSRKVKNKRGPAPIHGDAYEAKWHDTCDGRNWKDWPKSSGSVATTLPLIDGQVGVVQLLLHLQRDALCHAESADGGDRPRRWRLITSQTGADRHTHEIHAKNYQSWGGVTLYVLYDIYTMTHAMAFQTLADPTRLQIVEILRNRERAVNDIVSCVDIDQSGVSRHLRILHDAGFVQMRPDGQKRLYSLCAEPFQELDAWISRYRKIWEERLDRLEDALFQGQKRSSSHKQRKKSK